MGDRTGREEKLMMEGCITHTYSTLRDLTFQDHRFAIVNFRPALHPVHLTFISTVYDEVFAATHLPTTTTIPPYHHTKSITKAMSPTLSILLTTFLIVEIFLITTLGFAYHLSYRRRNPGKAESRLKGRDADLVKTSTERPFDQHCGGVDGDNDVDIEAGRCEEGSDNHDQSQHTLSPTSVGVAEEMFTEGIPPSPENQESESGMPHVPSTPEQPRMDPPALAAFWRQVILRGEEAQKRRLRNQQLNPRMKFSDWRRMGEQRGELERLRRGSGREGADGGRLGVGVEG